MLTTTCNIVNPLTLLSPARDIVTAKAAIQAGADAIYIGAERFGARHAAGNSLNDIADLVAYAHPFGVKILVTLNTLLEEQEKAQAVKMAWDLYNIGVDALIIQDLSLLKENLPPIRLHASTQCDNRTMDDVIDRQKRGFQRVVLARELSIDEIKAIHAAVPDIELEAFVHGALCVSYSGRCFMSEELLGRSANRGCCAQMCRMRYDLLDENMNEVLDDDAKPIHQRYLLSLQDMDRSLYLNELIDAGVTTFKIEGRLKDSSYVTNITAYYRQLLDDICAKRGLHCASKQSVYERNFIPNPAKTFHRGGVDYFLHGRTPKMANWQTPKSTGEQIGELIRIDANDLIVRLNSGVVLHNGDGLTIGEEGCAVNGVINMPNGLVRVKVNQRWSSGSQAVLKHLYRNLDVEFERNLKVTRKIPIDILFEETDNGFRLTIGNQSGEFVYPKQIANTPTNAIDNIRRQLSKLGDTIYTLRNLTLRLTKPYFIPISQLNEWRRQLTIGH